MIMLTNEIIKNLMWTAYSVAKGSPDPSSQNGALLVNDSTGTILARACNDFPDGIKHTKERWNDRKLKYPLVDHAEASVLLTAFRRGVFDDYSISEVTMICPWAACTSCAKHIIGFGLKRVIAHKQGMYYNHGPWEEDTKLAHMMFEEAGVSYELYDGLVGDIAIRRNGEIFIPDNHFNVKNAKLK